MHKSKSWCENVNICHITQGRAKKTEVEFKFDLKNNDVRSLFIIMNWKKW